MQMLTVEGIRFNARLLLEPNDLANALLYQLTYKNIIEGEVCVFFF